MTPSINAQCQLKLVLIGIWYMPIQGVPILEIFQELDNDLAHSGHFVQTMTVVRVFRLKSDHFREMDFTSVGML